MTAGVGVDETTTVRTRPVSFPALDSMRALAAVAVLATHASFWGGAYGQPFWGTALARLDIGVAIFFVLSGFLLSRPWFEQHSRRLPAPAAGHYLWKRALRILPVYVVAVVAAFILLPGNSDTSPGSWLKTLLMTNIYADDRLPDGLTQMWSLQTEVAFYLVLPILMWLSLSRRRPSAPSRSRFGVVVTVLVLVNVWWLMDLSVRLDSGGSMIRLWLPSYLIWFCVGMVIAACEVQLRWGASAADPRLARVIREMGRSPGASWTAALALFVIVSTPVAGPADLTPPALGEAMTKNVLYAAIAGLLILPAVFPSADGRFIKAMSNSGLRHLGHISYGIFSIHLVILELVTEWRGIELFGGSTLELFGLTLLLSLVAAELLYRLVERPSMRWRSGPFAGARQLPTTPPKVSATKS